ncbi:hypothetical protein ACVIWV_007219 [Bradyrhizobium diazoefficiens]|jgi:hypothetical protein|nr:hypothetical protein [Bradyrhizobium japonicum]MBP1097766.1 hypothetical protein [Bradyrhizobium japonicum]
MRNCASGDLEILRSAIALHSSPFGRPGMTVNYAPTNTATPTTISAMPKISRGAIGCLNE